MTTKEKINFILKNYGNTSQIEQAIEELSELILALQKIKRYGASNNVRRLQLNEEIADCTIMLYQLSLIFDKDLIHIIVKNKLDREVKRIETKDNIHGYAVGVDNI